VADDTDERGAGELRGDAFRRIVDATGNPFAVIDATGTIRYAGATMLQVSGWRADQLVGRNMAEFLPPHYLELALEVVAEIDHEDRRGNGIPMVFELLRPDGTTNWVEIGAMPMLDVDGIEGIVLRHRGWEAQHHQDEFVRSLLADAPIDEVLGSLARSIALSLEAAAVVIHHGFDGTAFTGAAGQRADGSEVPDEACALEGPPWVEAAATGAGAALATEDLPDAVRSMARAQGWGALWTTPIPIGDLGGASVSAWREGAGRPLAGHRQAIDRAIRYIQLALVRTAEHQQLRHLAGHDALTGVANRKEFRDELARALAIGERNLAVAFCDLDGFKAVNDAFGHPAGDAVLIEVAERLRSSLRVGDSLARMGGDEFTVLCRNVPDAAAARHVVERLRAAMAEPFRVHGIDAVVGISVGVALAEPGLTADALIAQADEALYGVKRSRRSASGGPVAPDRSL
jgi:diguanylate cyclase (GGDEF)-like protein/PAS domain S-box-containing protein